MNDLSKYQELSITEKDEEFIKEGLKELKRLIIEKELDKEGSITPSILDEIYPVLKKGTFWSKRKKQYAVMLLGIGLGECFILELGYRWILVKDELGEELSVKHDKSNWTSFPFSSVRKRIGTSEKNFFTAIIESFRKDIENNVQ